jgi:ProP effector
MSEARPEQAPPAPKNRARGRGKPARAQREVHPLLQRLWELHPLLFGARFRPLKVGIFEDLMARHPDAFSRDDLKQALAQHVRSTRYLEAVAQGDARHDLDGQPVEPVAPEHVQHAVLEVWRRRRVRDAEGARQWACTRLAQAIQGSGLPREAWIERARSHDPQTQALLDAALAEAAAAAARREALVRAHRASGKSVPEFAAMYGLDPAVVDQALQDSPAG